MFAFKGIFDTSFFKTHNNRRNLKAPDAIKLFSKAQFMQLSSASICFLFPVPPLLTWPLPLLSTRCSTCRTCSNPGPRPPLPRPPPSRRSCCLRPTSSRGTTTTTWCEDGAVRLPATEEPMAALLTSHQTVECSKRETGAARQAAPSHPPFSFFFGVRSWRRWSTLTIQTSHLLSHQLLTEI